MIRIREEHPEDIAAISPERCGRRGRTWERLFLVSGNPYIVGTMAKALLSTFFVALLFPLMMLSAEAGVPGGRGEAASAGTGEAGADERAPFGRLSESTGEREVRALQRAYPDRIAESEFRDGDWAIRIEDTWYYWAGGRMLPPELRADWESYASYRFYAYPLRLPEVPRLDEAARGRLAQWLEASEQNPPRRYEGFLEALYRARARGETESRIRKVRFLDFEVSVHEDLAEPLGMVERRLRRLIQSSEETREFVEGLKGFAGYNWRPIAGTRSRSYHSYGIAVDLVPKSYRGLHVYWRWAMPQEKEWYSLPYDRRWMVPQPVVKAFEEEGFIWGGKWFFFDTIHFEYRPEILVLARQDRYFRWPLGR
jgi:hypothetical protein